MVEAGLKHWADILTVILYFLFVLCIGLWSILKKKRGSVEGYFLAGRSMPWIAVGASIFGSNIGSEHFIGLAGAGASSGIVLVLFEWVPALIIQALSWFFLPVFVSAGVYTLPEYMDKRFGSPKLRLYLSVLALFLHILSRLSAAIFSGAVYIQVALNWNMYPSILGLLIITAIFTIFGGLTAVMYTDTAQSVIIVIGAFAVMGLSLDEIGGYSNLESRYLNATPIDRNVNTTCGIPRYDAVHVLRDSDSDFPWPSMILQCGVVSGWYWVCDQIMVQRCLAAKNITHAKGGTLLGGFLKILPLFLMVIPGMVSRIKYPNEVACVDPDICMNVCDNSAGCSNIAYPKLILDLLPKGARGLIMAVMLSAIVTSLTSIFNSSATVFTMDVWRKLRPKSNQRELLLVGRAYILVLCLVTVLWIPVVKAAQGGQIFTYIVVVEAFVAVPLPVLFALAVFWDRTTEKGAFYGIVITHVLGVVRLVLEVIYPVPQCGTEDTRPAILSGLHSFYFSQILILIQLVVTIAISLCTSRRTKDELEGTTWLTRMKPDLECEENGTLDDIVEEKIDPTDRQVPDEKQERKEETPPTCMNRLFYLGNRIWGLSADNVDADVNISRESRRRFLKESSKFVQFVNNSLAIFLFVSIAFLIGYYG